MSIAGVVVLTGALGTGAAVAQTDAPWILVDTQLNPPGEAAPISWDVTTTSTSMTVVESFGPDDTSGAEAVFEATWTPPPATLEPGDELVIPVTVSGRNTGNLETQYFFGLDVIMLVDDYWNNQAVGAGANCAQTTVISGEYVCSDPVTTTGELRTAVPAYGDEFSVGVTALNCGGACWVRWAYERAPTESVAAAPAGAVPEDTGDTGENPDGSDDTDDPSGTAEGDGADTSIAGADGGADEGGSDTAAIVVAGALVAAVAAGTVAARRRSARRSQPERDRDDDDDEPHRVVLELTYPVGKSPYVFQRGWLFGARAILAPGTPDERDISDTVRWSGDAVFDPPVGRRSRPTFLHGTPPHDMAKQRAHKRITLQVEVDGITTETTTTVGVTGVAEYARLGDTAACPSDSHGCPACPHPTQGPIDTASPTVLLNDMPAARVGDHGVHTACCGPNVYTIATGDESVLIDGRPAAHKGSTTAHCGGTGTIIVGSPGLTGGLPE